MSLKKMLAAERRRRQSAEIEISQLRDQLQALSAGAHLLPRAKEGLAQVVSQERRLEDEQDFVRLVIDSSPNLVYVLDEQGRHVLANTRYTEFLEQEAVLISAHGPLPLAGTLASSGTQALEECYRLRDGRVLCFATTRVPLLRADGSCYWLTFSSDVTDLKHATELAKQSVQSKQDFLANMSHEIRTPLHGVMGLVAMLKKEPLSAEQADYADLIRSSTEGLLVIINDTLDFAKLESGNIKLESIPFDIGRTAREAVRVLSFKVEEKGLLLRYEGFDNPLPLVKGDPFRLHQVIVNLVSNAIKFTPRGTITLSIEVPPLGESVLPITFRVADTGIGISAGNLEQVFDSFEQGDTNTARLYGGTGLGLSICKNLVQMQGGTIEVESAPGRGSCFSFTIPYERSDVVLHQEPAVGLPPGLLRGLHVLLVEDNGINQLIAVTLLGQWQVQVEMAQNGEEALLKAFQNPYDLILMDIQMPQLDGFEATARLRTSPGPNRNTPILALTADAVRLNSETSRAAGFTDYLIKPYSEEKLYNFLVRASRHVAEPLAVEARQYDLQVLGRLANDPAFVRQMLKMFVERVPGQVRALREALLAADWPAATREAHSLKTTFGTLNIQPEASYLRRLEGMTENAVVVDATHPFVQAVERGTTQFMDIFTAKLAEPLTADAASYQILT
ncbi:MAG: PAS domain-containing sensor histidine kinase [Hymenobacter sp.]|nr:MAG: PAS domain-containing sensor histidine kinase [Hymenobacter sp.]